MHIVNEPVSIAEDSTAFFQVDLTDSNGDPVIPQHAFLTVECLTNNQVTLEETEITAASSLAVKIPSSANAIINRANGSEMRRAIVRLVYGVDDGFKTARAYSVRKVNL